MRFRAHPLLIFAALATAGGAATVHDADHDRSRFRRGRSWTRGQSDGHRSIARRVGVSEERAQDRLLGRLGRLASPLGLRGERRPQRRGASRDGEEVSRRRAHYGQRDTQRMGKSRLRLSLALIRDLRLMQPIVAEGSSVNEAAESVGEGDHRGTTSVRPASSMRESPARGKSLRGDRSGGGGDRGVLARGSGTGLSPQRARQARGRTRHDHCRRAGGVAKRARRIPSRSKRWRSRSIGSRKGSAAAPIWVRLLATDSTNEDLAEKVVNALSREGNARWRSRSSTGRRHSTRTISCC